MNNNSFLDDNLVPVSQMGRSICHKLNEKYAHTQKKIADTTQAWEVAMLEVEELS